MQKIDSSPFVAQQLANVASIEILIRVAFVAISMRGASSPVRPNGGIKVAQFCTQVAEE